MAQVDVTPQVVDITAYGGDTLTIRIRFPVGRFDGREWRSEVRDTRDGSVVRAEFDFTDPAVDPDNPTKQFVLATLKAADTSTLAASGPVAMGRNRITGRAVLTPVFTGEYDVQVAPPGVDVDPVTTVMQGTLQFQKDVTRNVV